MKKALLLALFVAVAVAGKSQTAEEYYNKGLKLKEEKKNSEALEAFKEAVRLKSDYWAAQYEMGWCYNDLKQYGNALATLKPLRQSWSTIPKVFFETGYAFEKMNLIDSAITAYNQCLKLKSDYSLAYKQLGTIAYTKDDYTTALKHFAKYEEATKLTITDYLYWYRKGFMKNALKSYEEAKTNLSKSLEFKTDYINTYLELGFACTKLKQNEEAIGHFKKAMEIDPKSHIPYNGTAEVYRDNYKNIDEAMNWYKKTLAINNTERKACFGMGYCLNSKGLYNEAITYLKTAIEKEPDYTAAYVEIGYSYYKTNNIALALENLNKAMKLNPANENSRYYATLIYVSQGNKTMAQKMVDELKALNSKHVTTLQEKIDKM